MDRLDVFIEEFKKRSKELNIDYKTRELVTHIYNSIDKDRSVNYLEMSPTLFSIDSYCVLRHRFDDSMPLYNQGIFVSSFEKLRKVLGVPTLQNKINNTSFLEWHIIAKISFNNFHGIYVGIPIVVRYSGFLSNTDLEFSIISFDNRAIRIIDMITVRNPTKNDYIIR